MAYRDDDRRGSGSAAGEAGLTRRQSAAAAEAAVAEGAPAERADARGPVPEVARAPAATQVAAAPSASPKKGRSKKPVVAVVLAAALGFGAYEGWAWWTAGRFMVSTDDAYVQADITVLSAKISGYVEAVPVAANQTVKAGDLIARIDDGDYRLALTAAQDKLATQNSSIDRIAKQTDAARASVAQASAQIDSAKADAARADADYARQIELARSDFASKSRLDQAKADRDRSAAMVKGAEAALAAAQANVEVLGAQRVEAQRVAAELKTAVDKAARDLSFTEVRSPLDGVIGNKAVQVGTFVQPGTRLAALVPLTEVHVDANFKETQLGSLVPGQKVRIAVDAFPDRDITGTVESVAPASGSVFSLLPPENATGNFTKIVQRVPVRVAVAPDVARESLLRPGLSVVVTVDRRDRGDAVPAGTTRVGAVAPR